MDQKVNNNQVHKTNMGNEVATIKEASKWASQYLDKPVTQNNIQYLIQYGRVGKTKKDGLTLVNLNELKEYYQSHLQNKKRWKSKLGNDLDWNLSFSHLREADTTKHVHRLHPYKGKFIPQLVGYFLDSHVNQHKDRVYFQEGNTIIDPFAGSGTALVQAAELGINSIGIDISEFNCLITRVKLDNYDFAELESKLKDALNNTKKFSEENFNNSVDLEVRESLREFNEKNFPNPEFKRKLYKKEINEETYAEEKLNEFLEQNKELLEKSNVKNKEALESQEKMNSFMDKWFSNRIKQELFFYLKRIENIQDEKIRNVMRIVLSRTARSCRATTHSDLATLKEPQYGPYYCSKHKKICTPINSTIKHLTKNTFDTLKRIKEFSKLKKDVNSVMVKGDARDIELFEDLRKNNEELYDKIKEKKADGIFTSPPYVGQIDYHEQHAYSYELFGLPREDHKEIGPLYKGKGEKAKNEYVESIAKVFRNMNQYLKDNAEIFVVANDKFNLYPKIAEKSGLKIVDRYKRPVLNRTERDRNPYAETIFHMRKA